MKGWSAGGIFSVSSSLISEKKDHKALLDIKYTNSWELPNGIFRYIKKVLFKQNKGKFFSSSYKRTGTLNINDFPPQKKVHFPFTHML